MSKKLGPCKVRLVRGASFVIPGHVFKPGVSTVITDEKVLEALKRSQQFDIKPAGADDEDDAEPKEAGEETAPAPKKKKKRR